MLTKLERAEYKYLSGNLPYGSAEAIFIEFYLWELLEPIQDSIEQILEDWNKD